MKRLLSRFWRRKHGSTLIEAAVVLPAFLLVVFGTLEFTLGFTAYMSATYACRYGARWGAMHSNTSGAPATTAQIQAQVQSQMFMPNVIPGNITILVFYGDRSNSYAVAAGNYQGDLLGVGVLWNQTIHLPFGTSQNFYVSTQAYRVITR